MHTVIIGVGGVGGYFGGKIAHSGQKVTFVARGKHLEAMQTNGLEVKSVDGDFKTNSFKATDVLKQVEKADLILICTKSWQVANAGELIKPILKDTTIVMPLQNGADNAEKLCDVIDSKHVVGGLCKIYSKIEAPGIISHFGHPPEIIFGELDALKTQRLQIPKAIFDKAGFLSTISDNIHVDIWSKFMFIATVSGLGALTRATIGEMYQNPETRNIMSETATEIHNIGTAKGVTLPENLVDRIMTFISMQPFDSTASTQRDIMAGRPSELYNFNGFIVREGEKLEIATPTNHFIYSCLQLMENKARS
ncbi:ketopantoate reductase family protein [Aquimarina pacifica]|uniref:ketopantoate reductase family protein n=1 Tax=Aquimarina pacifica TaxID=1296415 RepID=UPI0004719EB8|nr:2-dehydropantoate 2-reductase [Aquimarina pacifica]